MGAGQMRLLLSEANSSKWPFCSGVWVLKWPKQIESVWQELGDPNQPIGINSSFYSMSLLSRNCFEITTRVP